MLRLEKTFILLCHKQPVEQTIPEEKASGLWMSSHGKIDTSEYQSFDQITARLHSIVDQVRDKNRSAEHSLTSFDEAIAQFQGCQHG